MLCGCENPFSTCVPALSFLYYSPEMDSDTGSGEGFTGLHLFLGSPVEDMMCVMDTAGSSRTVQGRGVGGSSSI